MYEKELKKHFKKVSKHLFCSKEEKQKLYAELLQMADEYTSEHEQTSLQDLEQFLGTPQKIADEFNQTLDPGVVERYKKKKKSQKIALVIILIVLFLLLAAYIVVLEKSFRTPVMYTDSIIVEE